MVKWSVFQALVQRLGIHPLHRVYVSALKQPVEPNRVEFIINQVDARRGPIDDALQAGQRETLIGAELMLNKVHSL